MGYPVAEFTSAEMAEILGISAERLNATIAGRQYDTLAIVHGSKEDSLGAPDSFDRIAKNRVVPKDRSMYQASKAVLQVELRPSDKRGYEAVIDHVLDNGTQQTMSIRFAHTGKDGFELIAGKAFADEEEIVVNERDSAESLEAALSKSTGDDAINVLFAALNSPRIPVANQRDFVGHFATCVKEAKMMMAGHVMNLIAHGKPVTFAEQGALRRCDL